MTGVCCTQLASNLYNKALDSAKKALPKYVVHIVFELNTEKSFVSCFRTRVKDNRNFPRSFGEDFGSFGPDGFHYLDDSQTECSGDYRDIEFNRDSYLFTGTEVIPELSDEEDCKLQLSSTSQSSPLPESEIKMIDYEDNPSPSNVSKENTPDVDNKKSKMNNFIGKIFKKKDVPADSAKSTKKSTSRECSVDKTNLIVSPPPGEQNLLHSLEIYATTKIPTDDAVLSNVTRQSPVNLVYGKPPEIFVEECTTLPTDVDLMARRTSQIIMKDALQSISPTTSQSSYANQELFKKSDPIVTTSDQLEPKDKKFKFFNFKFGSKNVKPLEHDEYGSPQEPVTSEPSSDARCVPEITINEPVVDEPKSKLKMATKFFNRKELKQGKDKPPKPKRSKFTHPQDFKFKNPKFFAKLGSKIKMQGKGETEELYETKPGRYPLFRKMQLPKIPESKNSTLSGHHYEGIQDDLPKLPSPPVDSPLQDSQGFSFRGAPPDYPAVGAQAQSAYDFQSPQRSDVNYPSVNDHPVVIAVTEKPQYSTPHVGPTDTSIALPSPSGTPEVVYYTQSQLELPIFEFTKSVEDENVGYEKPVYPQMQDYSDSVEPTKVAKIKNMVGNFGVSMRSRMKDLIKRPESPIRDQHVQMTTVSPHLKETNLDETIANITETEGFIPSVVSQTYKVDLSLDDTSETEPQRYSKEFSINGQPRKKKLIRKKFKLSNKENEGLLSEKNRHRLERFKNRATESISQFADKLKQQKKNIQRKKPPVDTSGNRGSSFDTYDYEFHFASDSELAPGSGVDSLRRSKVYKDLADAQGRLEMYMTPVSGPLRPPRSKRLDSHDQALYNQSLPSLSVMKRAQHRPPRPPPPKVKSCTSVPMISIIEDQMSRTTSMSSLWTKGSSRRKARKQRVPAEVFYRNVRLGYRPKKSYVEHLNSLQPQFYVLPPLDMDKKCKSLGHLSAAGFPVAPNRKTKPLYITKSVARACTSSPPPPPSRASFISNYDTAVPIVPEKFSRAHLYEMSRPSPSPYDLMESENELEEHHIDPQPIEPLVWSPFTWKVKRCRSLTEIDVRERLKKQCSEDRELSASPLPLPPPSTTVEQSVPIQATCDESNSYSHRLLNWLQGNTTLDTWKRKMKHPSVDSERHVKPPRPPLPPVVPPRVSKMSRTSSPMSSPIAASYCTFTYANTNNANQLTNYDLGPPLQHRPLPPPPVPPRPKLIPAHFAHAKPLVEKRDCAVDTSENGFLEYHSCEKEVQVKFPLSASNSLENQTTDVDTVPENTPTVDDEDDLTIVEERLNTFDKQTTATDYQDADNQQRKASTFSEWSEDDDDATINDDLSSLSSNYQSLASTTQSWLHNNSKLPSEVLTDATTTEEYHTAMEEQANSNRSSIISDQPFEDDQPKIEQLLDNYQQFQQAFQFTEKPHLSLEDSDSELQQSKQSNRQVCPK